MPDPVFILGVPRSGTTLLRVVLAGHPRLFSPPEMILAPFATMRERKARLDERFWERGGLRRAIMELLGVGVEEAKTLEASLQERSVPEVYAWLQERLGERRLVDKCPHLCAAPEALERLHRLYPEARWIWILRHPGSVTRSVQNMPMAEVLLQGYAPDARRIWHDGNQVIRRFLAGVPAAHQALVRYEALVEDPQTALRPVLDMLGLEPVPAMFDPYEGERMREGPPGARAVGDPNMAGRGRLQPELATHWLHGFDPNSVGPETHALARELGYDLGGLPPPPTAHLRHAVDDLFARAAGLSRSLEMPDELDEVEGQRFLVRMLSASLDLFVENGDPDHPRFEHAEGRSRKMFADCPDADYWRAPVRLGPGRAYQVEGLLPPGSTYLGLLAYGRGGRVGAHLADHQFVGPDGRFSLRVASEGPADLLAGEDTTALFIRQYFHDRAAQAPVQLGIRALHPTATTPLRAEDLTEALGRAGRNLEAVVRRTLEAWRQVRALAINRFVPIGGEQLFPTPDNRYQVCWYRLGPDQVLRVRGRPPTARYWSFCLYNAWMESLDYDRHTIHRHDRRIPLDADGKYELILSPRPLPGRTCLDTAGHAAGYLLLRALLPQGEVPAPQVEVLYERELG